MKSLTLNLEGTSGFEDGRRGAVPPKIFGSTAYTVNSQHAASASVNCLASQEIDSF